MFPKTKATLKNILSVFILIVPLGSLLLVPLGAIHGERFSTGVLKRVTNDGHKHTLLRKGNVYHFPAFPRRSIDSVPRIFWDRGTVSASQHFKLVFCPIPKTGCSKLNMLFLKLAKLPFIYADMGELHAFHYKNSTTLIHQLPKSVQLEAAGSNEWIRAVVLRDPVERLVSGFLDKMVLQTLNGISQPDKNYGFPKSTFFEPHAEDFYRFLQYHDIWKREHHFRPQSDFCGFSEVGNNFWERVLVYTEVGSVMDDLTASLFGHRIDEQIKHYWPDFSSSMWSARTPHSTHDLLPVLRRGICSNMTILNLARELVRKDYDFFGFDDDVLCSSGVA